MKHTIQYPSKVFDAELRTIIWDDEAGTVEGDHPSVPTLKWICEENGGSTFVGHPWGIIDLPDIRHDPQQFLSALIDPDIEVDPRAVLPDILKGIEPLVPAYEPPPPGVIY